MAFYVTQTIHSVFTELIDLYNTALSTKRPYVSEHYFNLFNCSKLCMIFGIKVELFGTFTDSITYGTYTYKGVKHVLFDLLEKGTRYVERTTN